MRQYRKRRRSYGRFRRRGYRRRNVGGFRRRNGRSRSKFTRTYGTSNKIRTILQPDSIFVKLKERFTFNTGTVTGGSIAIAVIRANDVYDPDFSLGGGQPSGFVEWMTLYSNFYVSASRVFMTMQNGAATTSNAEAFLYPSLYTSAPTGFQPEEQPFFRGKWMANSLGSGKSMVNLKHYMTTKRMFQQTLPQDELVNWGTNGSSPTQQWYWWLGFRNDNPSENNAASGMVEITYYCRFFNRRQVLST